jgi:cytochrome d ubiquinol oxidase subunit II
MRSPPRTARHFCFVVSNVLLAILIGAALGNVVRGVPVDAKGTFALAFFTNFSPRGNVGILDWYTVSLAVFALVTLAAHGANGLAQRTAGPVHDRSIRIANDCG